jgi:hypothetical protein
VQNGFVHSCVHLRHSVYYHPYAVNTAIDHFTTEELNPYYRAMFRNLATTSSRTLRTVHARQFSISAIRSEGPYPGGLSTNSKTKTDKYPDDKHAVNKVKEGDTHNVQEANAKAGIE